jgi:hypothetical protein
MKDNSLIYLNVPKKKKNNLLLSCINSKGRKMKIKKGLATVPVFLKERTVCLFPTSLIVQLNKCQHGERCLKDEAL